jgi:histidyl-tRNA synthetase
LCGGGRYDSLVEECGGPPTPAIGFSAGLERVIASLPVGSAAAVDRGAPFRYYVACVGEAAAGRALRLADAVRPFGGAQVDLSGRSRKKQVQVAEKSGARVAVIVDEGDAAAVTWRDLSTHTEDAVADEDVVARAEKGKQG